MFIIVVFWLVFSRIWIECRYRLNLCIRSKCGKIRTKNTPNLNSFCAVNLFLINKFLFLPLRNPALFFFSQKVQYWNWDYSMANTLLSPANHIVDMIFCALAKNDNCSCIAHFIRIVLTILLYMGSCFSNKFFHKFCFFTNR